jgi:ceramide glucosyltransferase
MLFFASVTAIAAAAAGCVYLIAAAILVRRFAQPVSSSRSTSPPSVTILKPLAGAEPGLFENLASFCRQNYHGPVQIIFGVAHQNDSAIAVVERLRSLSVAPELDLVIEGKQHGRNRKVSNLINMAPHIRHDVVVLADSDMRVDPDYLARVVAALEEPGVGAVTCLYYGVPATGIWSSLFALGINAYFLPSVVFGLALRLVQPCFGSTIALRRNALAAVGGLAAVADSIADDYALGRALRGRGYPLAIPTFAVAHTCASKSADELWRQELRWGRTIRSIDPWGYAGSALAHPLAWALIAMFTSGAAGLLDTAVALAALSIACRIALLRQVERAFRLPRQPYWLVPLRDLFSFAVFVSSFLGTEVSWRGRRYRMEFGGGWAAHRRAHS